MILQAENQTIRANVLLNRKREKVNRKYTQTVERKRQLSTGYLEGALEEVCTFLFLLNVLYIGYFMFLYCLLEWLASIFYTELALVFNL